MAFPPEGASRPPSELNLLGLLRLVRERSLNVELAEAALDEARADESIADAGYWPTLSIVDDWYYNDGIVQATNGDLVDVTKHNGFIGPSIKLSLDLGETIFASRAAEELSKSAQQGVRRSLNDELLRAAHHYFDLVEARAKVLIALDAQRWAAELVSLQEARIAGGSGLAADLAASRARLASADRGVIMTEARVAATLIALTTLMDYPPGFLPEIIVEDQGSGMALIAMPLEDLLNLANEDRPELAMARANTRAREHERDGSSARWHIPIIDLGVRSGEFGTTSEAGDQTVYRAMIRWDFSMGMAAEGDRARARQRSAKIMTRRLEQQVSRDVQLAHQRLVTTRSTRLAAEQEVAAAQEAFDLARKRYERGAGLLIESLAAEVELTRARAAQVNAAAGFDRAQYELLHSVGALWNIGGD